MTIEILKGETVFKSFECTEEESANLLYRAKLRAEVLNQKEETDEYSARIQPEVEPEPEA